MNEWLYREDLANKFGIHKKTLIKNINNLQKEFPNDESLFRYLGNKQYFYSHDINKILELSSKSKKIQLQKND
jgi:hypothetical protein|tara:strand:+ start:723 stop:941 length:219 start_codon:yes stop_codon:yes gene_type:complete